MRICCWCSFILGLCVFLLGHGQIWHTADDALILGLCMVGCAFWDFIMHYLGKAKKVDELVKRIERLEARLEHR
jgi:hypothetical protein